MSLPPHLLVYAENIYRRFPEEFTALGKPGLEDVFDLRPEGPRLCRITETPLQKSVEVTIWRWNASKNSLTGMEQQNLHNQPRSSASEPLSSVSDAFGISIPAPFIPIHCPNVPSYPYCHGCAPTPCEVPCTSVQNNVALDQLEQIVAGLKLQTEALVARSNEKMETTPRGSDSPNRGLQQRRSMRCLQITLPAKQKCAVEKTDPE